MQTRPLILAALLTAVLLGTLAISSPARGQQVETPPPLPMDCLADQAMLGNQIAKSWATAEVTLPAGHYARLVIPPETIYFGFCHVETGGQVTLSVLDCSEGSRYAPSADADAVLDQIVASCRIPDVPPEPYCPEGPAAAGNSVQVVGDDIQFTLPAGNFIVVKDPLKPRTVTVCTLQDNGVSMLYQIMAHPSTTAHGQRAVVDGANIEPVTAIGASCQVIGNTSDAGTTPAAPTRVSGITPPNTGSRWLTGSLSGRLPDRVAEGARLATDARGLFNRQDRRHREVHPGREGTRDPGKCRGAVDFEDRGAAAAIGEPVEALELRTGWRLPVREDLQAALLSLFAEIGELPSHVK